MRRNRSSAGTIRPELATCFGADRNETFRIPRIRQTHHFSSRFGNGFFVIAHNIGNQHHFGQHAACAFRGVFHRFDVAFVEVFQTGEQHIVTSVEVVFHFHNRGDGFVQIRAVKFQTDGTNLIRHPMQNKLAGGD